MIRMTKEQLAVHLDTYVGQEVGMEGLQTLIYGWLNWRKYGKKYRHAVHARNFLYITEILDLSEYAGYDLKHKKSS